MAIGTPTTLGSATGNSGSLTLAMTVTANVSIGDFIVVATGCFNSSTSVTVADSAGNTYGAAAVTANSNRTGIFLCKAATGLTSGVSTITVTWGTSQTARTIAAFKVTGLAAASQLDKTAVGTSGGTTTAWSAGTTAATTQADELVVGACSDDSAAAATSTAGAGYTEVHDITNGGAFQLTTIYKIVSSTGTQNPTGTWTSSGHTWNAAVATFKGDGGGGGSALTQNVDDTLTATDAQAKTATHPVADTGTLTDAQAKAATHPVADTGTLTDAVSKAPKHSIADTGTLTDAVSKAAKPAIADTGTLSDANAKTAGHTVLDTGTLTDATAKTVKHPVADTGTLSDNISTGGATNYTLPLDDTLTATDAQAKTAKHPVADTGTLTDAVSKAPRHTVADTGTLADVRVWTAHVALTDLGTLTDGVSSPQFPPTQDTSLNIAYTDLPTHATCLEASHAGHQDSAHLAYREHTT